MTEFYGACTYPHGGRVTALLIFSLVGAVMTSCFAVASCRFVALTYSSPYGGFDQHFSNPNPDVVVRHTVGVGLFHWLRPNQVATGEEQDAIIDWTDGQCAGYNQRQLSTFSDHIFEITRVLGIIVVIIGVTLFVSSLLLTCISFKPWQKFFFACGIFIEMVINPFMFYFTQSALCTDTGENSYCRYDQGALVTIAGTILYFLCFLVTIFWLDCSPKKQIHILGEQSRIFQQRQQIQLRTTKERERKKREREQRKHQKQLPKKKQASSSGQQGFSSPSRRDNNIPSQQPSTPSTTASKSPNRGGGEILQLTPKRVSDREMRSSASSPGGTIERIPPSTPSPGRNRSSSSRRAVRGEVLSTPTSTRSGRGERSSNNNNNSTPSPRASKSPRARSSSSSRRKGREEESNPVISLARSRGGVDDDPITRSRSDPPVYDEEQPQPQPARSRTSSLFQTKVERISSSNDILNDLKRSSSSNRSTWRQRAAQNVPLSVEADDDTDYDNEEHRQWQLRRREQEMIKLKKQQERYEREQSEILKQQREEEMDQHIRQQRKEQQQQQAANAGSNPWDSYNIQRLQSSKQDIPMGVKDYVRQIADTIAPMNMWTGGGGGGETVTAAGGGGGGGGGETLATTTAGGAAGDATIDNATLPSSYYQHSVRSSDPIAAIDRYGRIIEISGDPQPPQTPEEALERKKRLEKQKEEEMKQRSRSKGEGFEVFLGEEEEPIDKKGGKEEEDGFYEI